MRALLRRFWVLLALLAGVVLVVATYRDYGCNWDDGVQARYGELALAYFRSGFIDTRCNTFLNLRYYGPLIEMLPALLYGSSTAAHKFELRHLVVALITLLSVPALALYCRRARAPGLAGFAVLALVCMPQFYGHAFHNSKDAPFACLVSWSMFAFVSFCRRPGVWQALGCTLAVGLALCVRPGGLPLLVVYFVGAVVLANLTAPPRERSVSTRRDLARLLAQACGIFAGAWLIMIAPWPWAHQHPLAHPLQAQRIAASFTSSYPVLFEGTEIESTALPWYYLGKLLLITTPPLVLVLALIGVLTELAKLRSPTPRTFSFLLTLLWVCLPLGMFIVLRPNVYDGMRHFLFVLPALAVLAGFGAVSLCERATLPWARRSVTAFCCVSLLLPVPDLIALHPYQMTYFNFIVGNVQGADGRYDTDYWLLSYREAMAWVNQQAARAPERRVTVAVAGDEYVAAFISSYAASNVQPRIVARRPSASNLPEGVDYFIASKRFGYNRWFAGAPVVHVVGRQGAVFTLIKRRSAGEL